MGGEQEGPEMFGADVDLLEFGRWWEGARRRGRGKEGGLGKVEGSKGSNGGGRRPGKKDASDLQAQVSSSPSSLCLSGHMLHVCTCLPTYLPTYLPFAFLLSPGEPCSGLGRQLGGAAPQLEVPNVHGLPTYLLSHYYTVPTGGGRLDDPDRDLGLGSAQTEHRT